MISSISFQLLPNSSQVQKLEKMLHIGRNFWNYIVELDKESYKNTKKNLSKQSLETIAKNYKKSSTDLNSLHAHIYQVIVKNYCNSRSNAFQKFKKECNKPRKPSDPKPKLELPKLKDNLFLSSLQLKQYGNGCRIEGNKVTFNALKGKHCLNIKFRKHTPIPEDIHTVQIKRTGPNNFSLIITTEIPNPKNLPPLSEKILNNFSDLISHDSSNSTIKDDKIVGIDLGIHKLLTCSNGLIFENPRHIKQKEFNLKRLKDKKKLQVKGSNRYQKTCDQIRKLENKIKNKRRDCCHKIAKYLVLKHNTLVIEDLAISDMFESENIYRNVKKGMADASWGILTFMLIYKSSKYGKSLIKVPPQYTTQRCSNCGDIKKKKLDERKHECKKCGCKMDRDLNAAINVREIYVKGLEQPFGGTVLETVPTENPIP